MKSDDPMRNAPGPGRSTAKPAFDALTRDIASRNEAAHKAARIVRDKKEAVSRAARRKRDLS